MCCGSGGKNTSHKASKIVTITNGSPVNVNIPQSGYIWLTYTGANVGTETLWCPSGNKYKYARSARRINVLVAEEDAQFALNTQMFKVAKVATVAPKVAVVQEVAPAPAPAPVIDLSDGVSEEEATLAGQALAAYVPVADDAEIVATEPAPVVSASKAALKLADEAGLAIGLVEGTGKDGQITKTDVEKYLAAH